MHEYGRHRYSNIEGTDTKIGSIDNRHRYCMNIGGIDTYVGMNIGGIDTLCLCCARCCVISGMQYVCANVRI